MIIDVLTRPLSRSINHWVSAAMDKLSIGLDTALVFDIIPIVLIENPVVCLGLNIDVELGMNWLVLV